MANDKATAAAPTPADIAKAFQAVQDAKAYATKCCAALEAARATESTAALAVEAAQAKLDALLRQLSGK